MFNFTYQEKFRETLFTFKLSSADLPSIWRDFFHKQADTCEFYFRKKSWKNSWNFVYI